MCFRSAPSILFKSGTQYDPVSGPANTSTHAKLLPLAVSDVFIEMLRIKTSAPIIFSKPFTYHDMLSPDRSLVFENLFEHLRSFSTDRS